ncbi:MAG TPA: Maf family protein [Chthoniobacterales bacterium]|nr:Maf family protein [Chthoniobacterales bacterium]
MGSSLLLASNSPRRRQLLSDAGFEFQSVAPDVAEKFDVDLTLRELTAFNAIRKALCVARRHPGKVVLAADTLVALNDQIIGKPADIDEAIAILRRLSGSIHEVCSSVFICHLAQARSASFDEISRVRFRRLSEKGIERYIDKVDPLDKAGAYAAQGYGAEIIEKIEGSYTNVIGLPMEKTIGALAEFGIAPKIRPVRLGP